MAAGLRLQPLLLQLDAQCQQMPWQVEDSRPAPISAQMLPEVLLQLWGDMLARTPQPIEGSVEEKARLATSMLDLHSTACRLMHFALGRGSPRLAGALWGTPAAGWTARLTCLLAQFRRALCAFVDWHRALGGEGAGTGSW